MTLYIVGLSKVISEVSINVDEKRAEDRALSYPPLGVLQRKKSQQMSLVRELVSQVGGEWPVRCHRILKRKDSKGNLVECC